MIVRGATTAITRRTNLRKAFLSPWHKSVSDTVHYAMAEAQEATGVAVHHAVLVVNHLHQTVTPSSDNLPEYTERLHRTISRALNTLMTQHRYDAPRQLFDDRAPHQMRLLDAAAQASHLVYERVNCVAAGLVSRPEHMPGYLFDFGLWKTGGFWVERPDVYFGRDRPERRFLRVTPPPLLYQAFDGDIERLVHHMNKLSDGAARGLRDVRRRAPMGARQIRRLHPWSEPRTLRETGGRRVDTFRVGARGILGRETAVHAAAESTRYGHDYRQALRERRAGRTHRFPYGTYKMRVLHHAPVDACPPDAILCAPGPTLEEIQDQLEQGRGDASRRDASFALIDEVRDAFEEESEALCDAGMLDFRRDAERNDTNEKPSATTKVAVRHRFDKRAKPRTGEAARVVVLRDNRKGRPASDEHGSDPPR